MRPHRPDPIHLHTTLAWLSPPVAQALHQARPVLPGVDTGRYEIGTRPKQSGASLSRGIIKELKRRRELPEPLA
jgi:hypothetical protein